MRSCLIAILVASSSVGAAQPPDEYRDLFTRASGESAAGHFEAARDLFQQAHRAFPNSRSHRALGIVLFELRDYVGATQHLLAALNDERRPLSADLRATAAAVLDQAVGFVGRYHVVSERGFTLHVDGHRVMTPRLVLDRGEHVIRVTAPAHVPEERTIRVDGGENETVEIALGPDRSAELPPAQPREMTREVYEMRPEARSADSHSASSTQRAGVALMVSGATLVGAGILNHAAYLDASRAHHSSVAQFGCLPLDGGRVPDAETNAQCRRMVRRSKNTYPWIYVGYVVGGAALLTGVLLRVFTKRAPEENVGACSPSGLGMQCGTRF